MSNQQPTRKFSLCFRKCDTLVTYDESHKAPSGKHIPLVVQTDSLGQQQLIAHNCPLWKKGGDNNKQQPPQIMQSTRPPQVQAQPQAQPTQISQTQQTQQQRHVTDIQIAGLADEINALAAKIEFLILEVRSMKAVVSAAAATVVKSNK
jgi:hypothetical protein